MSIPKKDSSTHPLAGVLGATLEAGENMYTQLQNRYINYTPQNETDQDYSELTNEEVFDSGFENSNEGLELASPQIKGPTVSLPLVPPHPARPSSLFEKERDKMAESDTRPRSKTFNDTKISPQETTDKKLRIFLNNQSSVVV